MWQEIIVGLCVLAAVVFLAKRWLPVFKSSKVGCDSGCGSCGTTTPNCNKPTH